MKAVSIEIPPDKSISHRAVMLSSISEGATTIRNLLMAEDIKRTIDAFRAMGVSIYFERGPKARVEKFSTRPPKRTRSNNIVIVQGVGMRGLKKPNKPLYLGNSGTTMRILPGILAGQDFEVVLTGDESLSSRPMRRIAEPLRKMGAEISGRGAVLDSAKYSSSGVEKTILPRSNNIEIYSPLAIHGGKLKSINYKSKIASAQVKSCILLAGLYAQGVTSVSEPEKSRDHTERMLSLFGCKAQSKNSSSRAGLNLPYCCCGTRVSLKGPVRLRSPGAIKIPGDISSAAFFIVAGCILPNIKVTIKNVGLNPTRTGVIDILERMGADIRLRKSPAATSEVGQVNEPAGDIIVKTSKLKGVSISSKETARAIDEMPILMVAACFAKGRTIIKGVEELRVKETDRVHSMVTNLQKIGADIRLEPKHEHIVINGGKPLHGARVSSFGDHRTAMSMLVAGLGAKGRVIVTGLDCINKSFPNFTKQLYKMTMSLCRVVGNKLN